MSFDSIIDLEKPGWKRQFYPQVLQMGIEYHGPYHHARLGKIPETLRPAPAPVVYPGCIMQGVPRAYLFCEYGEKIPGRESICNQA